MILMFLDCAVCVLQQVMDLPEGGLEGAGVNLGVIMRFTVMMDGHPVKGMGWIVHRVGLFTKVDNVW